MTYAVFEDKNHMVFGTIDAHMEYTDCVNQLNSLVANLQPANPQLLWNYAVHSIDFTGVPFDAVHALKRAVQNLATDFSTGSQILFNIN